MKIEPTAEDFPEKTWKRALVLSGVALFGMFVGALLLASIMAGDIYDYQDSFDGVHLPKVDAIVVLAGGKGRISAGADLWYRYWENSHRTEEGAPTPIPLLYVSGMGHQANWTVFARQLRRGVLEVIRPENVVIENESTNTEENAIWLAHYAEKAKWSRVILMTSSYHMKRALMVLGKVTRAEGLPLGIETVSIYQDPFEPGEWRTGLNGYRVTLLEYIKGIYYKYFWNP
jgi:uncharacterized SAM-binding protein YcdF (DUF218 family)